MSSAQIGQKSYEMPPREGISITRIFSPSPTSSDPARYYEKGLRRSHSEPG